MTVLFEESEQELHRKKAFSIIEGIFKVLQDDKLHTISDISYQVKSHWRTIKNYIELISKIQVMPKIEILEGSKHILIRAI